MNIETKWLQDFLSLAHSQSFSRSAEERHITQPAFSRRIKALESALGCELIDRTSTPIQLTAEGRLFQITATSLVSQLDDCITHLQSLRGRNESVIDFAVSHTLSLSLFPRFLQSLQDQLPTISSRQLVANVDDSVKALENGISDFLLAFEDHRLKPKEFSQLDLQTEQLIPVCRANDEGRPLYELDRDKPQKIPYLSYPKDIYLGRCVEKILNRPPRPVDLQQNFESPMADSLKVMAMQGMGVAWVPSFAIREELQQGFLVPCGGSDWQMPLKVCIYRCTRPLSSSAETVWHLLNRRYSTEKNDSTLMAATATIPPEQGTTDA